MRDEASKASMSAWKALAADVDRHQNRSSCEPERRCFAGGFGCRGTNGADCAEDYGGSEGQGQVAMEAPIYPAAGMRTGRVDPDAVDDVTRAVRPNA